MDAPILYPQFGIYGLAQIQIQGSGKQITGIEFHSGGGISKYSLDRKTNNEERVAQWKNAFKEAQDAALDVSLGNQEALNQKKAAIRQQELDALEAEIEAENRRLELQQRQADLEKRKKEAKP
ncbi:MAG: hypothetical protein HC913_19430 [Microscillaceae bacterium]|nr:hypothetical protein [Microscillaceae bacterium]